MFLIKKKCNVKYAEPAPFQKINLGEYKITYLPDGEGYTIPLFVIMVQLKKIGKNIKNI